jgi:hypothetical protein
LPINIEEKPTELKLPILYFQIWSFHEACKSAKLSRNGNPLRLAPYLYLEMKYKDVNNNPYTRKYKIRIRTVRGITMSIEYLPNVPTPVNYTLSYGIMQISEAQELSAKE